MAITASKTIYGLGFGPFIPGAYFAPHAFCHHCPVNSAVKGSNEAEIVKYDSCSEFNSNFKCCNSPLDEFEKVFKQLSAPEDTAAVIIEPILGEGGYVVPPKSFLKGIREICTKKNILMIVDEVQSGFGRTGKQWAIEHFDVKPDILIFAKGVANGLPLSGIATRSELMEKQPPGSMGGTYAGNVVSCAAAIATIKAMKEENVFQNANERGNQLKKGLNQLRLKHKVITDVRGLGLMIGVEFDLKKSPTWIRFQSLKGVS
jgi:4-aminobutyrate aminotransferase